MKTGRPREYKNRVIFTTTMEAELLEKFKDLSIRDRRNMNDILQELIEKYVKIHADGNEQYTLDDPVMAYPALFRDFPILQKCYQSLKENEEDLFKFKLQEHIGLFKDRFGYKP